MRAAMEVTSPQTISAVVRVIPDVRANTPVVGLNAQGQRPFARCLDEPQLKSTETFRCGMLGRRTLEDSPEAALHSSEPLKPGQRVYRPLPLTSLRILGAVLTHT